jgi:hypothetical protein
MNPLGPGYPFATASSAGEAAPAAHPLEGLPPGPPPIGSPGWIEGSLSYFRAVGAAAEAGLQDLRLQGILLVGAEGSDAGAKPLASFLDGAWSSSAAGTAGFVLRLCELIGAERRARASLGAPPVDFQCNIPGVDLPPELFDWPGDSEFARMGLRYLRTWYLLDSGIDPREWMIPKVMCRAGDASFQ